MKNTRRKYRSMNRLNLESLENRLPLTVCIGGNCAPDLDMDSVAVQTARANEEFVLDLFAAGATSADVDENDVATGDTVILQLDPDDGPSNATLSSDGMFRWTPTADQTGTFEFVVIAIDEGTPFLADAEILTVQVEEAATPNTAPNLADIADTTVSSSGMLEVNLSATDAEGDNLTFTLDPDQIAQGMTIEQIDNNNAILRWTPTAADGGTSVVASVLVIDDGQPPMSDNEMFTIAVGTVFAADDTYAVVGATALNVDAGNGLLANDTDTDNDTLTVSVVSEPANGTLVLAADGSFQYTPDAGFAGTDTFTYQAADGNGDAAISTVTLNVNATPVAVDDSYTGAEDTTLTVDVATGVLANDTDADAGDTLTASVVQSPTDGTLTLNADGSFEFIPDASFDGTVSFTYVASDGQTQSAEATVSIVIEAANAAPVAVADSYSVDEDQTLTVTSDIGLLANDTDAEGDTLTTGLVDGPSNGTITGDADGSFVYTPDQDFNGTDSFTYSISDGQNVSDPATVTLEVLPIADAPIAVADSYTAIENVQLAISSSTGVLSNDSDADGEALTAMLVSGTTNGTVTLNSDGSFIYDANTDFLGDDSFTYLANDGQSDSPTVTVAITVAEFNQAPIGRGETYRAVEGEVLTVNVADGILSNDSDPDGDSLIAILSGSPGQGTLVLNDDGSFEYTANATTTGLDGFSYRVSDGSLESEEVLVAFQIAASNEAPVGVADTYSVSAGVTLRVSPEQGVLGNDTDIDSSSLSATLVDSPSNGTLILSSDGSFDYEPDANFTGTDTFTYRANDGVDSSELTTVTLVVA